MASERGTKRIGQSRKVKTLRVKSVKGIKGGDGTLGGVVKAGWDVKANKKV